jgi:hypothetical protein
MIRSAQEQQAAAMLEHMPAHAHVQIYQQRQKHNEQHARQVFRQWPVLSSVPELATTRARPCTAVPSAATRCDTATSDKKTDEQT